MALGFADWMKQAVKIAATFDLARRYGEVLSAPSPAGLDAAAIYRGGMRRVGGFYELTTSMRIAANLGPSLRPHRRITATAWVLGS